MKLCSGLFVLMLFSFCQLALAEAFSLKERCVELNDDGMIALNNKHLSEARECFENALKLDSNYSLAKVNLSLTYSALAAGSVDPLKVFGYKCLALTWQRRSNSVYSHDSEIRSAEIKGEDTRSRSILAEIKSATDQISSGQGSELKSAVIKYEESLLLKDDPDIRERLGDVFRAVGDNEMAESEFFAATFLRPSATLWMKLSQSYQNLGQEKESKEAASRALDFQPKTREEIEYLNEWQNLRSGAGKSYVNSTGGATPSKNADCD